MENKKTKFSQTLNVHLGMTGQLLWVKKSDPLETHTHIVFHISTGNYHLRYRDIRRFGQLKLISSSAFSSLLPDAWEASEEDLFRALRKKNVHLKHALLNQKYIVGLGNIYVDESLFMARLHPARKLTRVSDDQLKQLCRSIKQVLQTSIELGGTSFKNYVNIDGDRGGFKGRLSVYGKAHQPCPSCGSQILKKVMAGRGTHYCSQCQK